MPSPRRLLFCHQLAIHCLFVLCGGSILAALPAAGLVDTLVLGSTESEQAHRCTTENSETLTGGLGEPARQLLPPATENYQGGSVAFTMKVDPDKPNYLTARFWGSDRTRTRLILFCEGKQVGYRHIGDIDLLDIPNGSPADAGRFFYVTTPLPEAMTQGRQELHCEIRATGPIWGYGTTFAQYQKPMTEPSAGIYRVYTHTEGCFVPPPGEKQGVAPADPPVRQSPGPEVLDVVRARVNKEIAGLLARNELNQQQLWVLARAYQIKWTPAYHQPDVLKKAVATLDATFVDFRRDPKTVQAGKAIYNGDWFGIGPAATALVLLAEPLQGAFDEKIVGANGTPRREGWAEMFAACRDWHRQHRRQYTNQSMISDTYGLYLPNRAVALLDPPKALPEAQALRYLYESAGLQPWLGSDKDNAPLEPLGANYFQLTAKGLTRELGFVGYYGEVLDWMTAMYNASRPAVGAPGDAKLKAALIRAARARAPFRYPALDDDGNRAMRAETIVGWRDPDHYPGDVTYTQRPTWDASAIEATAATLDPVLLGGVQQMFDDNQFFATVAHQMKETSLRATASLLDIPDEYELIKAQAPSASRLPLAPGQPDFVFTDEEDGVLALKHGADILYASLYWRAHYAINGLARVHFIQPDMDRIAVIHEDTQFTPSGDFHTRQDWIDMGSARGGLKYPGDLHSANAGEKLPIAKVPAGVAFKADDENVYAGRGDFYTLRYGRYLIGMNMTADRSFNLAVPDMGSGHATALAPHDAEIRDGQVKVGPRSTAVLYLSEEKAAVAPVVRQETSGQP
jgi:hypothetical protein